MAERTIKLKMSIISLNLVETKEALAEKKFSVEELVSAYLERIEKIDPKIESYLFLNPKNKILENQKEGSLTGIPIAYKDVFCLEGIFS